MLSDAGIPLGTCWIWKVSGQEWLVQICQCKIEGWISGFNEDTKLNLVLLEVSALLVAKDSFCFICWTWSLRSGEQVSSFSSVIEANFGKHFFITQPMTLISWSLHFFSLFYSRSLLVENYDHIKIAYTLQRRNEKTGIKDSYTAVRLRPKSQLEVRK